MPPNFETLKANKRHKLSIENENMRKTLQINKNLIKDNTKSKSFRLMEPNIESKRVNILHNITQSESMKDVIHSDRSASPVKNKPYGKRIITS